jgi:hypothetical protein
MVGPLVEGAMLERPDEDLGVAYPVPEAAFQQPQFFPGDMFERALFFS